MRKILIAGLMLCSVAAFAVERKTGVLEGAVKKVDAATRTIVVKAADGTEHTFHFLKRTAVHGGEAAAAGAKDAFQGIKEGAEVAVHYSAKGTEETAEEIDRLGNDGLKMTEGTVTRFERGAKTLTVKTANGAEETYRLADREAREAGKDLETAASTSAKVTVHYSEVGGRKVAHFVKRDVL